MATYGKVAQPDKPAKGFAGMMRPIRGGGWMNNEPRLCRSAHRLATHIRRRQIISGFAWLWMCRPARRDRDSPGPPGVVTPSILSAVSIRRTVFTPPGFYVIIAPGECFLAVGLWRPEPESPRQIRQVIVEWPNRWRQARIDRKFRERFSLDGNARRTNEPIIRRPWLRGPQARYTKVVSVEDRMRTTIENSGNRD